MAELMQLPKGGDWVDPATVRWVTVREPARGDGPGWRVAVVLVQGHCAEVPCGDEAEAARVRDEIAARVNAAGETTTGDEAR